MSNLPDAHQTELPIIYREVENYPVNQRATDGYINATAMCKVAGRPWNRYWGTNTTQRFMEALSGETGISVSELAQRVRGGHPEFQGTWVHPQIAIHLAQWLSPGFAVRVTGWVFEWLSGQGSQARLPNHVRRYLVNRPKIPNTHFSMLDQMTLRILAPLEAHGYLLPPKMMPDIALGRMFSRWLRDSGYDPDSFSTYNHEFLDQRPVVPARLYPNELITAFNVQLETWMKDGRAKKYFGQRDPNSIGPLSRVLTLSPPLPTEEP